MNLLATTALTNAALMFKIERGIFRGLLFEYSGTAQSGQTVTVASLGKIQITRRGEEIARLSMTQLQAICGLKGGVCDTTSGEGAAFSFIAYLPFHQFGDSQNCLHINPVDAVNVTCTFASTLATYAGSTGNLYVYGIEGTGQQKYVSRWRDWSVALFVGDVVQDVPAINVAEMFVENETYLSKLSIAVDGEKRIDVRKNPLRGWTHIKNYLETFSSSVAYLDVDLNPTGVLDETLSDNVRLIATGETSASQLDMVINSLEFNREDFQRSAANREVLISKRTANTTTINPGVYVPTK